MEELSCCFCAKLKSFTAKLLIVGGLQIISSFLCILMSVDKLSELNYVEERCSRENPYRDRSFCQQGPEVTLAGLVDENSSDSRTILDFYRIALWASFPFYLASLTPAVILIVGVKKKSTMLLKTSVVLKILEMIASSVFLIYTCRFDKYFHPDWDAYFYTRPNVFDGIRFMIGSYFIYAIFSVFCHAKNHPLFYTSKNSLN